MKLKVTFPKELKGGPGSGHHGHAGLPGKHGGSAPGKGGGSGGDERADNLKVAVSSTYNEARILRKKYLAMPSGQRTVRAAKAVAKDKTYKKLGITWRDILAEITPSNSIIGDATWDRLGNTSKVK